MDLQALYREEILDHYQHPRNWGKPKKFTNSASLNNPFCGDSLVVFLEVKAGVVKNIHFEGRGCVISVAAASILSEKLKGKSQAEILALGRDEILKLLRLTLTPTRLKCALLSLETIHRALG